MVADVLGIAAPAGSPSRPSRVRRSPSRTAACAASTAFCARLDGLRRRVRGAGARTRVCVGRRAVGDAAAAASPRSATAMISAAAAASQTADDAARAPRAGAVLADAPFLAQPSGDLQPRAIGRLERRQRRRRRRGSAAGPRAARGTPSHCVEVHLELGAADRSDRAVHGLLDRVQVYVRTPYRPRSGSQPLYTLSRNSPRSRSRALCTCDFDVPSAMPSTSETSRCSSPSTSCSTNAARHPSGSSRERALEIDPVDRAIRQPMAARVRQHRRVVQPVGQLSRPRRPAADVIEDLVHRQPIQPRAERRLAAKAIQLPVRREEDLLQQVLRVGRVPQHPHREAEQPARVLRDTAPRTPPVPRRGTARPAASSAARGPAACGAEGCTVTLDVAMVAPRCPEHAFTYEK